MGYADESGIPCEVGLIKNRYVGRTFIQPDPSSRDFGVRVKLNPVRAVIEGKRVVVVDDSIVRGTTSRKIIKMIRKAGAAEVHFRISSPPTTYPCFYGIDTPTRKELIASTHSIEQIAAYLEVDSVAYLSHEGMLSAVESVTGEGYCHACFSGDYPIDFPKDDTRQQGLFERGVSG
jgi:amidophosphoribosyltransferase